MATSQKDHSILVKFSEEPISESPLWNFGGYSLKFVRLENGMEYRVNPNDYVKVVEGVLTHPLRLCFPGPFEKADTLIKESIIQAGATTLLMVISQSENSLPVVRSPEELCFKGPFEENLVWNKVESLSWGKDFQGLEFYNLRGWDLEDPQNRHVAYVQAWLAGKGVNCGDHDHSEMGDNTFREVHLCVVNGTGGGMVWYEENQENFMSLLSGEEHGPFWDWSDDLTKVVYPFHRWQGAGDLHSSAQQAFDFWFAVELPPPKAT